MKEFKSVTLFNEPSNILKTPLESGGSLADVTQMLDVERGFLCGLIREHSPRKIVEVV